MFIQRLIVTITVVETTTITVTQTGETYEDHTIDLAYHHDGYHVDDSGLRRERERSAGSAAHDRGSAGSANRDGGSAGPTGSGAAGGGSAGC